MERQHGMVRAVKVCMGGGHGAVCKWSEVWSGEWAKGNNLRWFATLRRWRAKSLCSSVFEEY